MHPGLAVERERDLGHLGGIAAIGERHRDAAGPTPGQRRAPSRFLGRPLEHAPVERRLREQRAPVLEGILAGGMGELVDERLHDEGVLRGAHRSPEADGNPEVLEDPVHLDVGNGVGQVGGALDGGGIDTIRRERPLPRDEGPTMRWVHVVGTPLGSRPAWRTL